MEMIKSVGYSPFTSHFLLDIQKDYNTNPDDNNDGIFFVTYKCSHFPMENHLIAGYM